MFIFSEEPSKTAPCWYYNWVHVEFIDQFGRKKIIEPFCLKAIEAFPLT